MGFQKTTKQDWKRTVLIIVAILVIPIILFLVSKIRSIFEYNKIFDEEISQIEKSSYTINKIDKDIFSGAMTIELEDGYDIKYKCNYALLPIDTGKKVNCEVGNLGALIFSKHQVEVEDLVKKYSSVLAEDNTEYIFRVYNEDKLKLFFNDLIKISDYKKSYDVYKKMCGTGDRFEGNYGAITSYNCGRLADLDYIMVRGVSTSKYEKTDVGLFSWAVDRGI